MVNAASLDPAIASGTWVSIFGTNLSTTERIWAASDFVDGRLPTQLDGVSVRINGKLAYVYYVSPTQLNVLAPEDAEQGTVPVEVLTWEGKSDVALIRKQKVAPALFTFPGEVSRYVAAVFSDGTLAVRPGLIEGVSSRLAKPGDHIALYATGLGQSDPAYPDGEIIRQPAPPIDELSLELGKVPALIEFAGIVGPGLYQINVQIPDVPDGDAAAVVRIESAMSQAQAFISVQK